MSFGYCGSGAGVALYVGLHLNPKYQVYMCAYKNISAVSWLGDWLQRRLDWICEQYQMAGDKRRSSSCLGCIAIMHMDNYCAAYELSKL